VLPILEIDPRRFEAELGFRIRVVHRQFQQQQILTSLNFPESIAGLELLILKLVCGVSRVQVRVAVPPKDLIDDAPLSLSEYSKVPLVVAVRIRVVTVFVEFLTDEQSRRLAASEGCSDIKPPTYVPDVAAVTNIAAPPNVPVTVSVVKDGTELMNKIWPDTKPEIFPTGNWSSVKEIVSPAIRPCCPFVVNAALPKGAVKLPVMTACRD